MQKHQLISENLQKIHSSAEEVIASHVQRLDRISNDIRALEEILLKAGIPFKFSYSLKREFWLDSEGKKTDQTYYYLIWDKKRIIYEVSKGYNQTQESLPLIETKSQVRLFVENELASFYEKIIFSLKEDPMQDMVLSKSPNFKEIEQELPF